jgi:hypothetical protein
VVETLERELTAPEQAFVEAYTTHFDEKRAAYNAGFPSSRGKKLLEERHIKRAVDMAMEEKAAGSRLNAEYVRDYIVSILELCPTDYFLLGPKGEWMIDPVEFKKLPVNVKRLVDSVETKLVHGQMVFKVNFVSKQAALAMAAKITLVKQVLDNATQSVPWDEIARAAARDVRDPIAERLRELDSPGPPRLVVPAEAS